MPSGGISIWRRGRARLVKSPSADAGAGVEVAPQTWTGLAQPSKEETRPINPANLKADGVNAGIMSCGQRAGAFTHQAGRRSTHLSSSTIAREFWRLSLSFPPGFDN